MIYQVLADVTATIHTTYVAFVLFGLILILIGKFAGWNWVTNRWFRSIHLVMIGIVLVRATLLDVCPLTTWEEQFRELAGQEDFEGSGFGKVMHDLIHPEGVALWVFPIIYAVFGALIVATLWLVPVNWRGKRELGATGNEGEGLTRAAEGLQCVNRDR